MKYFLNTDVIMVDSVDSTNEEIKRRIQEFSKPTWLIAKKQIKGKGRNGNRWISSSKNFSGSIILFPSIERSYFHLFGFFIGVALYNTVKQIVKEEADIRLKWPNDLMIENGKVAGILLETVQTKNMNEIGLIIGVGVNLNSSPNLNKSSNNRYKTQNVAKFTNNIIDRVSFFSNFCNELIKLGSYIDEKNLCSILDFWEKRSFDKGTKIQISDHRGQTRMGTFLGLDEMGGLIVGEKSGNYKIYSGDVYFGI